MGVLHTTEGSWNSAMSVFRQHYAPQFMVGVNGRIAQLVPLNRMAAALKNAVGGVETNRRCIQVELEGRSQSKPYQFPAAQTDALADLMATLKVEAGIPLIRFFADDMPPLPWATTGFVRRRAGYWGRAAGWYGHVEVPENDHWDPGFLRWSQLISKAKALEPKPPIPKSNKFTVTFRRADGKVFRTSTVRWPRVAITSIDLAKNKITRIDIKAP